MTSHTQRTLRARETSFTHCPHCYPAVPCHAAKLLPCGHVSCKRCLYFFLYERHPCCVCGRRLPVLKPHPSEVKAGFDQGRRWTVQKLAQHLSTDFVLRDLVELEVLAKLDPSVCHCCWGKGAKKVCCHCGRAMCGECFQTHRNLYFESSPARFFEASCKASTPIRNMQSVVNAESAASTSNMPSGDSAEPATDATENLASELSRESTTYTGNVRCETRTESSTSIRNVRCEVRTESSISIRNVPSEVSTESATSTRNTPLEANAESELSTRHSLSGANTDSATCTRSMPSEGRTESATAIRNVKSEVNTESSTTIENVSCETNTEPSTSAKNVLFEMDIDSSTTAINDDESRDNSTSAIIYVDDSGDNSTSAIIYVDDSSDNSTSAMNANESRDNSTSAINADASTESTTSTKNAGASTESTTSTKNADASTESTTSTKNADASTESTTSTKNAGASTESTTSTKNADASTESTTATKNADASTESTISTKNADASTESTTSTKNAVASTESTTPNRNVPSPHPLTKSTRAQKWIQRQVLMLLKSANELTEIMQAAIKFSNCVDSFMQDSKHMERILALYASRLDAARVQGHEVVGLSLYEDTKGLPVQELSKRLRHIREHCVNHKQLEILNAFKVVIKSVHVHAETVPMPLTAILEYEQLDTQHTFTHLQHLQPDIVHVLVTRNGLYVMADAANNEVKVLRSLSSKAPIGSVPTMDKPRSMGLLSDGLIAVTVMGRRLLLLDIQTMSVASCVTTPRNYVYVTEGVHNTLIVSTWKDDDVLSPATVDVITRKGVKLKTIISANTLLTLQTPGLMCVLDGCVLFPDLKHAVYKVDVRFGTVVDTLRHDNLQVPCQVVADQLGNVFVACAGSRCVMVRYCSGVWQELLSAGSDIQATGHSHPAWMCLNEKTLVVGWVKQSGKDVLVQRYCLV